MKKFNFLDWLCLVLLIIGGLDAGFYGVSGDNLFSVVFKDTGFPFHLIYILFGISALYMIYFLFRKK